MFQMRQARQVEWKRKEKQGKGEKKGRPEEGQRLTLQSCWTSHQDRGLGVDTSKNIFRNLGKGGFWEKKDFSLQAEILQ